MFWALACCAALAGDVELLRAASLASSTIEKAEQAEQRFRNLCADVQPHLSSKVPSERVLVLFEFMHRRVLTGEYQVDCNDITRTLDEGHYNCLTATIVLRCFCRHFDVPTTVVETPDHVCCRLGAMEIETTCAQWFSTGKPPGLSLTATPISDVQLVARVYYNMGLNLAKRNQFSAATSMLRRSHELDPYHQPTEDGLASALNNWSLILADDEQFADSITVLERAKPWSTDQHTLLTNRVHIHSSWVKQLCREGEYGRAAQLLQNCVQRYPHVDFYKQSHLILLRAIRDRATVAAIRVEK